MTKYSFENFYINMNNKQAFLAARYVAEHLGEAENPLYIYGGVQTGKTHILHAIEQYLNQHNHDLNVLKITTEEFVYEVLNVIRTGHEEEIAEFREKFRSADVLLMDDIQWLANKKTSIAEFILVFNAVYEAGGQIVITGNTSLREMREKGFPESLVSRLEWGRVVEIPSDMQYTGRQSVYDILHKEDFSIPKQYTALEYFQELWLRGLREYIVPEGEASYRYLRIESMMGLSAQYGEHWDNNKEIKDRWEYELDKINKCEMNGYYLVLGDLAKFAVENDILMSPGCGPMPGSLVAYCLGITDVDPIKHNLLMERFLSQKQERLTECRIELEIGGSQCLTNYVVEKYGKGMMKLLGMLDITFHDLEEVSVIKETLKNISDNTSQSVDLSMINDDDNEVFDLINSEGIRDTKVLRELFNDSVAKGIEVKSMEDLIARLSLNHPGLEERCCEYINNKNNPDGIYYECQELKPILAPTYGCIVYQEQIMQILADLGGFSPEESNLARRGMSKRKMVFNETARHDFIKGNVEKGISGCVANGISETTAERIFDDIWTAAIYGFIKAHSTAYALLTYRIAWLKLYYREEYMDAIEYVKTNR